MKPILPLHHKLQLLSALLLLATALLSCQVPAGPNGTTPAAPTQGSAQPQKTNGAAATPGAAGAWSLSQPGAGLEALTSYHQIYTSSMKGTYQGNSYVTSTTEERTVNGQDESSLVNATTSSDQPVYLQITRSGGQTYVQQKAGQSCRAQDRTDSPDQNLNPALKLPPVFSGTKVGSETLAGLPAVHYHFDAAAVRYQAGKNGTADGDVWVAQDGAALLKYQLTVEIKDGDFIGSRNWTYELSEVNKAATIALPDGCLPLLSDIPTLPGAAGVVSLPGFTRYAANSSIDAAVKFFQDQLLSKNWYAIPGDKPQPASALLKFARSMADGSGQLLVIQLATQDQSVQVVMQILKTHQPIQAVSTAAAVTTPQAEDATETPGTASSATLPDGLPVYPGAQVILQNSQMLMCQAAAPLDQVARYYQDQMASAGWSLTDSNSMGTVSTQKWEKDGTSVMVIMTFQNGQTQVVISPQ